MKPLRAAVVLGFLVGMHGAPALAQVPKPDPLQGDGRVSEFYIWSGELSGPPGRLLRSEPLPATLGLANAASQERILYTSTDGVDGKSPITVSGALFIPKGTPPQDGWPLLAWAHGTVGIADICAPSWQARSYRDVRYLNEWLSQGFAIVATDYQGLGTPGPHPYLKVRPEAYSVLDSVRAVLKDVPGLANKIVVIGQSQGGGAAFATAAFAPDYAPELDIRGSVATGIPYLAPKAIASARPRDVQKVDRTISYLLYIALMAQQSDAGLKMTDLFTARALPVLEQARVACIANLENDVVSAGLTRANALLPEFEKVLASTLPSLTYPSLKLRQPIFVGTGQSDQDVLATNQLELVKDACEAGTTIEAHLYAGLDHSGTVMASLKHSVPFVRKVMSGEPVGAVCDPHAE